MFILSLVALSVAGIAKAGNTCNSAVNAVPVIFPGPAGPPGPPGVKGDPGTQPGGAVYTRWGRTTCPAGATLVYAGYAASTGSLINGGTSDTSACRKHLSTSPLTPQLHLQTNSTVWNMKHLGLRQRLSIMSKNTTCHAPSATQTPKKLSLQYQLSTPALPGGTMNSLDT